VYLKLAGAKSHVQSLLHRPPVHQSGFAPSRSAAALETETISRVRWVPAIGDTAWALAYRCIVRLVVLT